MHLTPFAISTHPVSHPQITLMLSNRKAAYGLTHPSLAIPLIPISLPRPPALPIPKPNKIKIRLRRRNQPHHLGRIAKFSGVGWVDAHFQRGFPKFDGSCTRYKPSLCAPGCI